MDQEGDQEAGGVQGKGKAGWHEYGGLCSQEEKGKGAYREAGTVGNHSWEVEEAQAQEEEEIGMRVEMVRAMRVIEALLEYSVDATHSEIIDLKDVAVVGLILPTIVTGDVTFEATHDPSVTPVAVKAKDGTALTITAGTGGFAVSTEDLAPLAGYRYIRVVTAGTQTSDVIFLFIVKT